MVLLGVTALVASLIAPRDAWWMHGLWCVATGAVAVAFLVRAFRHGIGVVLVDHRVVFTASFLLYFVFGAFLFAFPNLAQAVKTSVTGYFTASDLLWVDGANAVGFGIALIASALVTVKWLRNVAGEVVESLARIPAERALAFFLVIGGFASALVLWVDLGLGADIISGVWRFLSDFGLVAIFLGSVYRGAHARTFNTVAGLVAVLKAAAGAVLFSKVAVLLPLVAWALGVSVRRRSAAVIVSCVLGIALLFPVLGRVVTYGRNTLVAPSSSGALSQRWQLLIAGVALETNPGSTGSYSAWARLSYIPEQVLARTLFDSGMGSDGYRLIPWTLVPRALFPAKPIITGGGREFYRQLSGNPFGESATSPGIFLGGYHSAGWLGLLLYALGTGCIIAFTSTLSQIIIKENCLVLLPFALSGLYIAFRIDGHFVSDYVGAVVLILYPVLLIALFRLGTRRT